MCKPARCNVFFPSNLELVDGIIHGLGRGNPCFFRNLLGIRCCVWHPRPFRLGLLITSPLVRPLECFVFVFINRASVHAAMPKLVATWPRFGWSLPLASPFPPCGGGNGVSDCSCKTVTQTLQMLVPRWFRTALGVDCIAPRSQSLSTIIAQDSFFPTFFSFFSRKRVFCCDFKITRPPAHGQYCQFT